MAERVHAVRGRRPWLTAGLVVLVLLGLGLDFAVEGPPWAGGRRVLWSGSSTPGHIGARFRYFDGNDGRPIAARTGGSLTLRYDLEPSQGILALRVLSPGGDAIWTRSAGEPAAGRYRVEITGQKSRGSFDVSYHLDAPAGQ